MSGEVTAVVNSREAVISGPDAASGRGEGEMVRLLQGYDITEIEMSGFRKMSGGLTCLSLLL